MAGLIHGKTPNADSSTKTNPILVSGQDNTSKNRALNVDTSGDLQVDIKSITAGTSILGKVGIDQTTANANEVVIKSITAGDNNIGNVDIVTLPSGNLGQKTSAASLSVTPATDVADATYIGDIKFGEALPSGTNNIGDVDIISLPSGNLGAQAKAASLCVNPASDISDATYIGDIKFGEALPAGTANIGLVGSPKGSVTTAHDAIEATATSAEIDCTGYNAVMVIAEAVTETWKIDVQGAAGTGGTFVDLYDNYDNQLTTGNLTAARGRLFVAIPNFIKIVATEVVDGGACTVKVIPMVV
jgi:hypothetical protein